MSLGVAETYQYVPQLNRLGRLNVGAGAEDSPPAEGVDDQWRGQISPIRLNGGAGSALDFGDLEPCIGLLPQRLTERAVVEARPTPREPEAR